MHIRSSSEPTDRAGPHEIGSGRDAKKTNRPLLLSLKDGSGLLNPKGHNYLMAGLYMHSF